MGINGSFGNPKGVAELLLESAGEIGLTAKPDDRVADFGDGTGFFRQQIRGVLQPQTKRATHFGSASHVNQPTSLKRACAAGRQRWL